MMCNTSLFDKEMFKSIWKAVISAIAYAFISFEDDYIIERSIAGFRQCATLAGHFHLPDVFDYVVVSLSQATSLLSESLPTTVPNYPVVTVEDQPVTVSTLSVKFGTNFRGQLAAVVLFNIVNGNGNALREGWTQVRTVLLLCMQSLLMIFSALDIRDVHNIVCPHLIAYKHATDGRLLGWNQHDSIARKLAISTCA
jgi:brefeldin A-resistance guanine nucleotide exchange factor 1